MSLSLVTGLEPPGVASPPPDRRAVLARTLTLSMTPEEMAVQALDGVAFADIEAARTALRNVSAALEFVLTGRIGTDLQVVEGD